MRACSSSSARRRTTWTAYPRVFERQYEPMRPETRSRLAGEFAEPNERLYALLGRNLGWE